MTKASRSFQVEQVGMLDVNCYLIPTDAQILYIIDPGDNADTIVQRARSFAVSQIYVLLTHAHIDHIRAVGAIAQALSPVKIYLNQADCPLYFSPKNHLLPFIPPATDLPQTTPPEDTTDFHVIPTPGHTPGSVCYHFPAINALFSGDTLFKNSIGRTDLPGGDSQQILRSIRESLFVLPDHLAVYPGHGPATTIGAEKQANPFL